MTGAELTLFAKSSGSSRQIRAERQGTWLRFLTFIRGWDSWFGRILNLEEAGGNYYQWKSFAFYFLIFRQSGDWSAWKFDAVSISLKIYIIKIYISKTRQSRAREEKEKDQKNWYPRYRVEGRKFKNKEFWIHASLAPNRRNDSWNSYRQHSISPFGRKIKSSRSTRCISLAVAINRITAGASERRKERKKERKEGRKKKREKKREVGVKSVKLRKVVKHEVAGIGWKGEGVNGSAQLANAAREIDG